MLRSPLNPLGVYLEVSHTTALGRCLGVRMLLSGIRTRRSNKFRYFNRQILYACSHTYASA